MATLRYGVGSLSLAVTAGSRVVNVITLTVAAVPSSLAAGQLITVAGVNGLTGVNGDWTVTSVTATTVVFSVTSAGGTYTSGGTISRKYATIEAWDTATRGALGGNIKLGEMYADSVFEQLTPTNLIISGATGQNWAAFGTPPVAFRGLYAWPGHAYNLRTDTGVKVRRAIRASSGVYSVIQISEPQFKLQNIGFELVNLNASIPSLPSYGIYVSVQQAAIVGCSVVTTDDASTLLDVRGIQCRGGTYLTNNIVWGSNTGVGGSRFGIYYEASPDTSGGVQNCFVYGFKDTQIVVQPPVTVRGCYAHWSGFSGATGFECAAGTVSDSGTSGSSAGGDLGLGSGNVELDDPTLHFRNIAFKDVRMITGGRVASKFVTMPTSLWYYSIDIAALNSAVRDAEANLTAPNYVSNAAPINAVVLPVALDPVQVIDSTIGSTGAYPTIAAWEAATTKHLVGLNQRHRGLLIDTAYPEQVTVAGAVTDDRCYRELTSASENRFVLHASTGPVISNSSSVAVVSISESFFRLSNVEVVNTISSLSDSTSCVRVAAPNVTLDSVCALCTTATGTTHPAFGFLLAASSTVGCVVRNCLAIGGTTDGLSVGFSVTGGASLQNCLASRISRSAGGVRYGFYLASSGTVENCVAGDVGVGFYYVFPFLTSNRTNASFDSTALGSGSLTSLTSASCFSSASSLDFRPIITSPLLKAGTALSIYFSTDADGNTRTRPWSIGPYASAVVPPLWKKSPTEETHRYVPLWKIETQSGDTLLISGHSSDLVHRGELYECETGIDSTAQRMSAGLEDNQVEAFGFISSGRITFEDLDAGLYNNAKVSMYLVDWKYPWLQPFLTSVFFLRRIRFDGESWRAEAEGLTSVLRRTIGRSYSAICPYRFGSQNPQPNGRAGCGVDAAAYTSVDIEVATIETSRRVIRAKSAGANSLSSTSDGWYKYGTLTFLTGANSNRTFDVIEYLDGNREITLGYSTPFDIAVGDRFNIVAGDDHSFDTCVTKFGNGPNFGGEPYIPGIQKASQTP